MPSWNLTAELQAKALKWVFGLLLFGVILLCTYLQGRDDGKLACQNAVQRQVTALAQRRADNAIQAGTRLESFVRNDAQLETGIAGLLAQVQDYYANKPAATKAQTVKVQLPGKKEYVYVPTDSCSPNVLDADELRLYNMGNKRSDANPGDSKDVSGKVPSGPP